MKTFENRATSLPLGGESLAHYSDLALIAVNYDDKKQGFTAEEVHDRVRIISILKAATALQQVQLEDADAKKLLACINVTRWSQPHPDVDEFVTYMRQSLA